MAHAFRPRADGAFSCRLEGEEKSVIAQVAQEVGELIRQDLHLQDGRPPAPVRRAAASEDPLERLEAELAGTPSREPRDSAVQRLFPDASEDPEIAAEMRRLSQAPLAQEKVDDLRALVAALDSTGPGASEVVVRPEDVPLWLRGLNDLRLVLADRLNLTRDGEFETLRMLQQIAERVEDLEPVEPEGVAGADIVAAVYELLTWLQESLLRAMDEY